MSLILQFLPLLILAGLAWGVASVIKTQAKKYPAAVPNSLGPSGVGGWLLLLVLGLMCLGPLLNLGNTTGALRALESGSPNLLKLPVWQTYKTAVWCVVAVVCCLTFYAGLGLLQGRNPGVVRRAAAILWLTSPGAFAVQSLLLPLIFFGSVAFDSAFFLTLATALLVAGVWTSYLYRSKRVAATYGLGQR